MDFAEATRRLNEGRRKEHKQIGHKLKLHRLSRCSDSDIALEYFSTDILTFRADGGVIIKFDSFIDSACTVKNVNEFLPNGWSFEKRTCRFNKKTGFAVVRIRDPRTYKQLGCYPYEDNETYYEQGRTDLMQMCALDALDVAEQIKAYTERIVHRYLHGEYTQEILESAVGLKNGHTYPKEKTLRFLRGEVREETFMQLFVKNEMKAAGAELTDLYWKENYPFTKGGKRSVKDQVAYLEWRMRGGTHEVRPAGNSTRYQDIRKGLLSWFELFFLNNLGFRTFSTERVHRERSKK